MTHVRATLARIAGVFTGHRQDDDLRDELQSHRDMETAEYPLVLVTMMYWLWRVRIKRSFHGIVRAAAGAA